MFNSDYWIWAKRRYDPWYQYWVSMKPVPFFVDPNCPALRADHKY